MAWIPGITTQDISAIWRNDGGVSSAPARVNAYQVVDSVGKTGYQYQNYFNRDVVTLQSLILAGIRQPTTIDTITKSDKQPRNVDEIMSVMPGNPNA